MVKDDCGTIGDLDDERFEDLWVHWSLASNLCDNVWIAQIPFEDASSGNRSNLIQVLTFIDIQCGITGQKCGRGTSGELLIALRRVDSDWIFVNTHVVVTFIGEDKVGGTEGDSFRWSSPLYTLPAYCQAMKHLSVANAHCQLTRDVLEALSREPDAFLQVDIIAEVVPPPVKASPVARRRKSVGKTRVSNAATKQCVVIESCFKVKPALTGMSSECGKTDVDDAFTERLKREVAELSKIPHWHMRDFHVVGGIYRHDVNARTALIRMLSRIQDAVRRGKKLFLNLWAAPGWGKTFFVKSVIKSVGRECDVHFLTLTKLDAGWEERLKESYNKKRQIIAFVDEVDKPPKEEESAFFAKFIGFFDSVGDEYPLTVLSAGSTGSNPAAMVGNMLAQRDKLPGIKDFISRVGMEASIESIPDYTKRDCVLAFLSLLRHRLGSVKKLIVENVLVLWLLSREFREIREIEHLVNDALIESRADTPIVGLASVVQNGNEFARVFDPAEWAMIKDRVLEVLFEN